MDTRSKIHALEALRSVTASSRWILVAGYFDPMTAVQAGRLAEAAARGRKLLAVVIKSGDSLLPAEARAMLVAGLRAVDAVSIAAPDEWRAAIPADCDVKVVDDIEADATRSAEFVRFILARDEAARAAESAS